MGSKYSLIITRKALEDLEQIYVYILGTSLSKEIAKKNKEEYCKRNFFS